MNNFTQAEPRYHSAPESMLFSQRANSSHSSSTEHPEVTDFSLNSLVHHLADHPIEPLGRMAFEKAVTVTRQAACGDNVISVLEQREHMRQHFRRILQIRIHHSNSVSRSEIESSGDRGLMPEITAEENRLDAVILVCSFFQLLRRPVHTTVINENKLVVTFLF